MNPRHVLVAIALMQIAVAVLALLDLTHQWLMAAMDPSLLAGTMLMSGMVALTAASGLVMLPWPRLGALLAAPTLLAQSVGGVAFGALWYAALWPRLDVQLVVPGPGLELYTLELMHHVFPPHIQVNLDRPSIGFGVDLNLLMLVVLPALAWAALHPSLRPRRAASTPDGSP